MAVALLGSIHSETPSADSVDTSSAKVVVDEFARDAVESELGAFEHDRFVLERAVDASRLLSSTQKGVLHAIVRHLNSETGTAWPSYATIAAKAGYERSTAIDAIAELEQLGWVQKEVRRGADGWHQSNVYRVRVPAFDEAAIEEAELVRGRRYERRAERTREAERVATSGTATTGPSPTERSSSGSTTASSSKPSAEAAHATLDDDEKAILAALEGRRELGAIATPTRARELWQVAKNYAQDRPTTLAAITDAANKTPTSSSPQKLFDKLVSFVSVARPSAPTAAGTKADLVAQFLKREAEEERARALERATAVGPPSSLLLAIKPTA